MSSHMSNDGLKFLSRGFNYVVIILIVFFCLGVFFRLPEEYYNNLLLISAVYITISIIVLIILRFLELIKLLKQTGFKSKRIRIMSSMMTHFSILFILFAWFLSSYYTTGTYQEVPEGAIIGITQKGFPFDLQVNKIESDSYSDDSPRQYSTNITVIKDNTRVFRSKISVNHPLSYLGVKIYQYKFIQDKNSGLLTGLYLKKDPGVCWLYTGFILFFAAVLLKGVSLKKHKNEVDEC